MNAGSSARRAPVRRGRPRIGQQAGRAEAAAALLEAAEDVAAARGLDAATIAAIARRAGVAVGTLYNYFPDREALFASLFRMRREELVPRIETVAREATHLPFERRLRAFLAGVLAVFEDRRKFLRVVMADHRPPVQVRKPAVLEAMTRALAEILAGHLEVRAEDYAYMVVGALKGLVQMRIERDEPMAGDGDLLADMFLEGIQAVSGHAEYR
jgi:AcrR family transcriptional regulator